MTINRTLDKVDKHILSILQKDGRLPVIDLAKRVNLSKTPCLTRLRRLEHSGHIVGYHAHLNPHKIGKGYLVYVQVKLANTTSETLTEFNKAVMQVPDILSCHMLSGGYDYLLKIRASNMLSYRELLGDILANLPGVMQTASFPVMEEVKDSVIIPIEGVDT